MKPDLEQVDRILTKVTQIIEDNKQTDRLNQQMQQEKRDLTIKLNEREKQLEEVEEKLRSLKIAHRMLETTNFPALVPDSGDENISANMDNKELKIKIDDYIKEIDKCIATLNN